MGERKQVLSCIQPTGNMHFGRYFGAVRSWVELQQDYDCLYGIVDYHAMTMPYSPKKLRELTWDLAFNLLAVGIKKENLFIQSLCPEHTELAWIFNCFTSYGHLHKMTQFKDKSSQVKDKNDESFISVGLFDYPVLQAADILIYKADYVPVGKDQEQHLELSRDVAKRFNHMIGKEYFVLPEPLFTETPKIMSTADPSRKMSASLGEKHNINIFSDEQRIRKQIRSAVTDTGNALPEGQMSAGVANLFSMLRASGKTGHFDRLISDYREGHLKYVDLKEEVADALVGISSHFRAEKEKLLADKKEIRNQIKDAAAQIRKRAQQTLKEVKELTGLMNVRY